jgi:rhamnogalacturonyl hydrolase YesR
MFAADSQPSSALAQTGATLSSMERMADAQLALYGDKPPSDWIAGAFYVGLARLSHVSSNPKYLAAAKSICDKHDWQFHIARATQSVNFADNQCIGQLYTDQAVTLNDHSKLDAMRKQLDETVIGFERRSPEDSRGWGNNLRRDGVVMPWWWCDSFFMAPAVFTRLSAVTGDKKYIDAMDKQWWFTAGKLYDTQEHLFYRDGGFLTQKTANGKKIFWSRGNGWVVAGVSNVLAYMPKDYPTRLKYETLLKEMCTRLADLQGDDGLWRVNLLDAPTAPAPETSGTAFFCYGMAWGINNGILDRAKFEPVVMKAWAGLNLKIRPDGLIGSVQAVSDRPLSTDPNATQPYAVGGYLLSGCEVLRMMEKH